MLGQEIRDRPWEKIGLNREKDLIRWLQFKHRTYRDNDQWEHQFYQFALQDNHY